MTWVGGIPRGASVIRTYWITFGRLKNHHPPNRWKISASCPFEVADEEMDLDLVPADDIYQEYQPPKNKKMRVDSAEKSSEEDGGSN